jgi:hypothetical protein
VIPAAALLVLLGLGLFVGGILTGVTVLYWACVAACVLAGVLLVLAHVRMERTPTPSAVPSRPAVTAVVDPGAAPASEPEAAPGGDHAAPPDAEPMPAEVPSAEPRKATEPPSTAAHAHRGSSGGADASGDPPVEEVEVTDLLLVVDLRDDVLVVDEHPRYHLGGCRWLTGRETIPLPLDEARTDGFTPCAWCEPDRTLAEGERARRAARRAP